MTKNQKGRMEINRETLHQAIGQLPEYEPSGQLWEDIREDLDRLQSDKQLRAAINQLPSYSPDSALWEEIAAELEKEPKEKTVSIRPFNRWRAAAAGIAALVVAGLLGQLIVMNNTPDIQYNNYAVEVVALPQIDWTADDEIIRQLLVEFKESPNARRHENYTDWSSQLEELYQARTELVEAMSIYGEDKQLIEQLNEIDKVITNLGNRMYKHI